MAEAEAEQARVEEIEDKATRFGGRAPLNRARALKDPTRTEPLYSLNGPAITVYSRSMEKYHGVTPTAGANIFGKSTNFSKPISEYKASAFR
jgi:hypothetical protein